MKRCEFKEVWNRHNPDCQKEAAYTVEARIQGARVLLVLCHDHRDAVLLNESLKAVDVSNTEEARHETFK